VLRVLRSNKARVAAVIGASVAYLAFLEFANRDSWIHCPIRALTGHKCPGCGLQTALFDLMHGDVAAAFASNQLLFIAPVFVGAGFWAQKKNNPKLQLVVGALTAVVVVLFVLWRNGWLPH